MTHFQKFGRYEIIRKLSRSMTDVYLAFDPEANRTVALKLIEHSRDEYTQLIIEAEKRGAVLQTQLHAIDPRILEVYESGEQNNCFFIAMEYFDGKSLAEILALERRLDPKRAAGYAAEICSQLRSLHSFVSEINGRKAAVVHGDVKPSNVQIGGNGQLRLLDFGIAKAITSTRSLTHHNLGSPTYCSPERISNSQVDQHADLWAVGVTLYEMVGGAPPYQAQDTRKLENLIQSRRPFRALPLDCPAPIKVIVAKALASDIGRRYQSAEAFESDLRAFLDGQRTVAERERQSSWNSNATIEKAHGPGEPVLTPSNYRPDARKPAAVQTPKLWKDFNVAVALLAGILAGLLLFFPIGYYYRLTTAAERLAASRDYAHADLQLIDADWKLYRDLKSSNRFLQLWSPVGSLDAPMRAHLISAAENILDSFRHNPDQQLGEFDWTKASTCLRRALEIDPADVKAKGELALCTAYLSLAQKPPKPAQSVENFRQAESYLPRLPDPHLGLARVYVYQFHNVGRAVAEFHQAEQLGYRLGPRELEQEADGYLFRAESALARARRTQSSAKQERAKWLQLARDDMERARNLYEPIVGFSNVSTNLAQLQEDGVEQVKLQMENVRLVTPRPRPTKHYVSVRRWQ
jgi:eukaryotic-like serine/threonine-protein kinase